MRICTVSIAGGSQGVHFPCNLHCPIPQQLERREDLALGLVCIRYLVAELGTCRNELLECVERATPATPQTTSKSGEAGYPSALPEVEALVIIEL